MRHLFLLVIFLAAACAQPLYGFEKQLLYSFQDPDEVIFLTPQVQIFNRNLFIKIDGEKHINRIFRWSWTRSVSDFRVQVRVF